MDRPLTSHHVEIMRRSLACGGLPSDEVGWLLEEAARLLDERDRARSLIAELVGPMADVRSLLNKLHALLAAHSPQTSVPAIGTSRDTPRIHPQKHV